MSSTGWLSPNISAGIAADKQSGKGALPQIFAET
jgi:hypothetical protein